MQTIKEVATHINTALKTQHENAVIIKLQDQFKGNVVFLAPGRRFLRQVQVVSSPSCFCLLIQVVTGLVP